MGHRPTYDEIQKRAFELWEQRGRPSGYESEFWAQAERELRLELAARSDETGNMPKDNSGADSQDGE